MGFGRVCGYGIGIGGAGGGCRTSVRGRSLLSYPGSIPVPISGKRVCTRDLFGKPQIGSYPAHWADHRKRPRRRCS